MSTITPSMRNMVAVGLLAGLLLSPSVASAAGGRQYGHHGGHHNVGRLGGHHTRGPHVSYGYRGHIGGLHLGLSFGHQGSYAGRHHGYRQHHGYARYGYGYRSPYYGTTDSYSAAPHVSESSHVKPTVRAAWNLLAAGRYAEALLAFGHQASGDPGNSLPKIGYALASAMSGDLRKAVWAMRRALHVNPDALEYVTVSRQLRRRIEHLVHDYEQVLTHSAQHADASFMIATLHQLLGESGSGY